MLSRPTGHIWPGSYICAIVDRVSHAITNLLATDAKVDEVEKARFVFLLGEATPHHSSPSYRTVQICFQGREIYKTYHIRLVKLENVFISVLNVKVVGPVLLRQDTADLLLWTSSRG